uniref:P-type domain-containing protein n=1 Tax=Acrobeloides nanus TaxID=290746 RepID=A0A914E862_9BILA
MTSISCLLILLFILFLKDASSVDPPYGQLKIQDQFLADSPLNRIDCDPEPGANQATCIARGCIYDTNEVTLGPAPHLVYRTIGGQLEIFFFPGPTPEQVIQQYQQVIGTPFMPSYWALGFHSWGDFGNYTNYLHQQGMHVMLITDPAIEVDYPSFQRGLQQNASFIEWPRQDMVPQSIQNQYPLVNGTKIMLGVVWPDKHVAFPDFLDPTAQTNQWWVNEFATFRQTVAIDGIWIDMNEPSNFNTQFYNSNSTTKGKYPSQDLSCPISGPDSEYDTPPYLTWSGYYNGPHVS